MLQYGWFRMISSRIHRRNWVNIRFETWCRILKSENRSIRYRPGIPLFSPWIFEIHSKPPWTLLWNNWKVLIKFRTFYDFLDSSNLDFPSKYMFFFRKKTGKQTSKQTINSINRVNGKGWVNCCLLTTLFSVFWSVVCVETSLWKKSKMIYKKITIIYQ